MAASRQNPTASATIVTAAGADGLWLTAMSHVPLDPKLECPDDQQQLKRDLHAVRHPGIAVSAGSILDSH